MARWLQVARNKSRNTTQKSKDTKTLPLTINTGLQHRHEELSIGDNDTSNVISEYMLKATKKNGRI